MGCRPGTTARKMRNRCDLCATGLGLCLQTALRTRERNGTMKVLRGIIVAVAAVVIVCPQGTAATFTGIGNLGGDTDFSEALGVSGDGKVVVGRSKRTTGEEIEAVKWSGGTLTALGDLTGGIFGSEAYAASYDGSVIVGRGTSASGIEAFRWSGGSMSNLGDLTGGDYHSEAYGVSGDGSVVVGWSSSGNGNEAFRWTSGLGMYPLGDLTGGSAYSKARGVSSDGTWVAGEGNSGSGYEAFRWELTNSPSAGDGDMTGLGDLPYGAFASVANGISPDGQYVVGSGCSLSGFLATIWSESNGMLGLGYMPGGNYYSVAKDVSSYGQVVVGYAMTAGGRKAFIFDSLRGMRNLKDVLENDYGLDLSDWTLTEATGVSDDGTVIVGIGVHSGDTEGWVANLRRGDIDPATHTWDDPEDWDATMAFVLLDGNGDVEIEIIKYVWVDSAFDEDHCRTDGDTDLEHLHFEDEVDTTGANAFWDWYYNVGSSGVTRTAAATNVKESIAYAMDGYAGDANYDYWLVHGAGDNQANTAFSDDCHTVSDSYNTAVGDRLVYDEGEGTTDGIYDHASIIKTTKTQVVGCYTYYYVGTIEWKCGYSGVYGKSVSGYSRTPSTPGSTNTTYIEGLDPSGTYAADFWSGPVIYRKN